MNMSRWCRRCLGRLALGSAAALLSACRFVAADLIAERAGARILEHEDRRVAVGIWRWYTVEFGGREATIGEPWYATEQRRFAKAMLLPGDGEAVIVKVLAASRSHAYSHYATFLLERDPAGVTIATRLSPENDPTADGADIHWPVPDRGVR